MYNGGRTVTDTPTARGGQFQGEIRSQGSWECKTAISYVPNLCASFLALGVLGAKRNVVCVEAGETVLGVYVHLPHEVDPSSLLAFPASFLVERGTVAILYLLASLFDKCVFPTTLREGRPLVRFVHHCISTTSTALGAWWLLQKCLPGERR